jgi:hypothetical protein
MVRRLTDPQPVFSFSPLDEIPDEMIDESTLDIPMVHPTFSETLRKIWLTVSHRVLRLGLSNYLSLFSAPLLYRMRTAKETSLLAIYLYGLSVSHSGKSRTIYAYLPVIEMTSDVQVWHHRL